MLITYPKVFFSSNLNILTPRIITLITKLLYNKLLQTEIKLESVRWLNVFNGQTDDYVQSYHHNKIIEIIFIMF